MTTRQSASENKAAYKKKRTITVLKIDSIKCPRGIRPEAKLKLSPLQALKVEMMLGGVPRNTKDCA
jgi:hypothetical protein